VVVCVRNDSKEIGIAGKVLENLRKILDTVDTIQNGKDT